ncbi:hypothetical protein D1871_04600 [Nakamurella silvestris]|nr:hypothetical protein D1871_04600 [Nakamurella silvestris]
MSDFYRTPSNRRLLPIAGIIALVLAVGVGGYLIGHNTTTAAQAGAAAPTTDAAVNVADIPTTAPWTLEPERGPVGPTAPVSPPADNGFGWSLPRPGVDGPAAVTDLGVPYGYTRTDNGAELAAVNAVIGSQWLKSTFDDSWAAMGFLLYDWGPDRQTGLGSLQEEFTRQPALVAGMGTTVPTAAPTPRTRASGGAAVLSSHTTGVDAEPNGVTQVMVMWQEFSLQNSGDAYDVWIHPITVELLWQNGDWKVTSLNTTTPGQEPIDLGTVPAGFPVPTETWHQ